MRTAGLYFQILLALAVTANGQVVNQDENESSQNFVNHAMKLSDDALLTLEPKTLDQSLAALPSLTYVWHTNIVTTIFWVGEAPAGNNPIPNQASAWDLNWSRSYGGADLPDNGSRQGFVPAKFVPRQNPFYFALPYNDVCGGKTKPEASRVIPWFKEAFVKSGQTVLKDRWIAMRKDNRVCYAQWEDVGPFRTDHWEYVFGNDRPRPNLNRGAGLDVSPAVRDYLHMGQADVMDWKFVESSEVPPGPWALYGENNPFVINRRKQQQEIAKRQ
ncbi:MAG: hypothetical protein JO271_03095 [Verrucomicrobia bacterium]|nr:hypothetical protein [Verrucomicrobiota bacterium]